MIKDWKYDGRCLNCGGQGTHPTAASHITWVPWTICTRCQGTGFDPAAALFSTILN